MFKNEFQGGPYVEVFSAQGRDPVAKWRLSGNAFTAKKIYDREVKSYVVILEGESTTTKMSIPKDEKQSLFLIQKYLIMQIYVPLGHAFSLEIGISDMGNNKRRIFMSSNLKDITITPLHARFPLKVLRLGVWLNLCLDLNSLVEDTFKGPAFKAIESLTIAANCHLRKIFTMKAQPPDTTDDDVIYSCASNTGDVEVIPRNMQLTTTPDVQHYTQVISITKLRQAELYAREAAGLPPPSTPVLSEADSSKQDDKPTHIAFGSRVTVPKHARKLSREGSSSGGRTSTSSLNRSSSVTQLRSASPQEVDSARDRESSRYHYQRSMSDATELGNEKTQLGVEATQTPMQPRPPRTGSGNKTWRRPVRVRGSSGGKGRSSRSGSTSESKKLSDSTSSYHKSQQRDSTSEKTEKYERDSDSHSESISRSHSESSLKASGNDSSLGESFSKLNINGHKQQPSGEKISGPRATKDAMFTFASKPRSAPRSPRVRQKRKEDSVTFSIDKKPEIIITPRPNVEVTERTALPKQRGRAASDRSEYDEDFYRASGESSDEDDLQKLLKSSKSSRSSSRGSRRSPMPSPGSTPEPPETPHILRTSIRSSLLKEIPFQSIAAKTYDAKSYQSNASSWRLDMSGSSGSFLDQSFNSSMGGDSGFPSENPTSNGNGKSRIIHDDGMASMSDDSDESCSTWKVPPPPSKRLHTYQDEMMHPGPEPDLSATLPMDPRAYTDVFSPPIIMPSEKKLSGQGSQSSINSALSPSNSMNKGYSHIHKPRSHNPSISSDQGDHDEGELDLLYDPCLNCYFDPKTHKYYELA